MYVKTASYYKSMYSEYGYPGSFDVNWKRVHDMALL